MLIVGAVDSAVAIQDLTNRRPAGTEDQVEFPSCPQRGAQAPQAVSLPGLQRKLKEAARKILSLHLEKEQLLEIGNRLRAELGHPEGRMPPSLLPSTGENWEPREVPEVTLDRGPPLGQLQPYSKTQDPMHTKRKCVSEYAEKNQPHSAHVVSKNGTLQDYKAGVAAEPAQRQRKISTGMWKSICQKENRSPKLPQGQEVPEESDHHTHRSSSPDSSALQDTWKLLDLGSSLSGLASQNDSSTELPAPPAARCLQEAGPNPVPTQGDFAVKGLKIEAQPKATPPRPSRSHLAKPASCLRHPKIRNYNLKD